jgi:YfiH family protein
MECPFFQASNLRHVVHGFFSNGGSGPLCNVAFGRGDSDDVVLQNRQRVANSLARPAKKIVFTMQAHTNNVVRVDELTVIAEPCDGLVTASEGILLGIYTADCVPVLLFGQTVVGVAHCGWKGLQSKLIEKTIEQMYALGACDLTVAIGPCIGKKNYVVSEDFLYEFPDDFDCAEKCADGWHMDLRQIAQKQLMGVQGLNVQEICLDTYDHPEFFFSCRRSLAENAPVRTQASVIML